MFDTFNRFIICRESICQVQMEIQKHFFSGKPHCCISLPICQLVLVTGFQL